uniref:Uncharacterized protein n=1 Tax=Candidatus Kentrum sp. DK TaxID=2126562 RepID=A0A450SGL7_9GAMM|nr:MAG: hypothetical protein BECKDK2373C_GA0170839_103517 [Candidatus Kentron sp. DK]
MFVSRPKRLTEILNNRYRQTRRLGNLYRGQSGFFQGKRDFPGLPVGAFFYPFLSTLLPSCLPSSLAVSNAAFVVQ